jgi:hypothetical protein
VTASNIAKTPAGRARGCLRTAMNKDDMAEVIKRVSYARTYVRNNDRLSTTTGLSEAVEQAYALARDAKLDQGQSLPAMRLQVTIALAILDEVIEGMRPSTLQVGGRTYRLEQS